MLHKLCYANCLIYVGLTSILSKMFLPICPQGYVFVDRDGKHFRHILNWLRDGIIPTLNDSEYSELLREAEYYQLIVRNSVLLINFSLLSLLFCLYPCVLLNI